MWGITAVLLLAALVACGSALLRGEIIERFAALQVAGAIVVLELMVLARLMGRDFYHDAALTLAVASFAGSLAFIRSLGHWL